MGTPARLDCYWGSFIMLSVGLLVGCGGEENRVPVLPVRGKVLLDGRPVTARSHAWLHRRIAMVGQEPVLFARSIAATITECSRASVGEKLWLDENGNAGESA